MKAREGDFLAEREIKTAEEVKKISAALMMAEVGLAEGIHALKNSRIGKNGQLLFHNVPLTSEKLRSIIEIAILQAGGLANHTSWPPASGAAIPTSTDTGAFAPINRSFSMCSPLPKDGLFRQH